MSAAPDARRTVASPLGAAEAFNALATAEAGTTTPRAFLKGAGSVIASGLERLHHESSLAARSQAVVAALISALDARDEYTGGHSAETSELALCVGQRLGMTSAELDLLSQVAVLHDVGKLGIPTDVLLKEGPLDPAEQAVMREHPAIGERILSGMPGLGEVAHAVRCEHERWDGRGYPDGLAGEQIPLASRIVFACDSWHAMTSDRPYRPAMAQEAARAELRAGAGRHFDPRVVQALLESLGDYTALPACSPRESRDRVLSEELSELAEEIGARDLFVFREVAERHFSHLGGIGRGAGWAGNIELDSREEPHLAAALRRREPEWIALERTGRIVGPYWGRSAVVVPCGDDTVVVFGSPTEPIASPSTARLSQLAERARSLVIDVSPAKRLADELEVLAAVREVTTVNGDNMGETLVAIAARARAALSAEFAAVATIPSPGVDPAIGIDAGAWEPRDIGAAARALTSFGAAATHLPMLCQDLSQLETAPEGSDTRTASRRSTCFRSGRPRWRCSSSCTPSRGSAASPRSVSASPSRCPTPPRRWSGAVSRRSAWRPRMRDSASSFAPTPSRVSQAVRRGRRRCVPGSSSTAHRRRASRS